MRQQWKYVDLSPNRALLYAGYTIRRSQVLAFNFHVNFQVFCEQIRSANKLLFYLFIFDLTILSYDNVNGLL